MTIEKKSTQYLIHKISNITASSRTPISRARLSHNFLNINKPHLNLIFDSASYFSFISLWSPSLPRPLSPPPPLQTLTFLLSLSLSLSL
jgi:hypothetical protein